MVKEETWSVSIDRARAFFREQPDMSDCRGNEFIFPGCSVLLTELKPKGMGIWAAKRIKLRVEGEDEAVADVYHRFFIQFLSTGG